MATTALSATTGIAQAAHGSSQGTTTSVGKAPVAHGEAKAVQPPLPEALKPQRDPRSLQFQVENGRIITRIVDTESKSVITQIPDVEVIRLAEAIDRLQGFFVRAEA